MAKKPKIGGLLDDVAEKVIKPEPQGIRAYHGSPHDFDRFDLSKIGTGEGAQAYGHGLYFAGNEAVAKGYRNALSDAGYQRISGGFSPLEEWVYDMKAQGRGDLDTLMSAASRYGDNYKFDQYQAALDKINGLNKGHMYEVNIRANPEDFLDWDKPLAQQPDPVRKLLGIDRLPGPPTTEEAEAVFELARKRGVDAFTMPEYKALEARLDNYKADSWRQMGITPPYRGDVHLRADELTGGEFLHGLEKGEIGPNVIGGSVPNASAKLRDMGIPGIKYLDAGSRAAGDGSRNYVVFDDALIEIIRKYGIVPGGLLGAGVAMAPSNADAAPSRPDWIGDNGAITANPPWLRPDPNERSALGKLYDAVTTNPVGTFKAAGSALGDAVKGYLGEVRQDPGKGVADALELGATAMGGAAPQAFWMATSPDTANAGEGAILAQRRKMMQGLLAD